MLFDNYALPPCNDDPGLPPRERLSRAIDRGDSCFVIGAPILQIPEPEGLVEQALSKSSTGIASVLIQKYGSQMETRKIMNILVSSGQMRLSQEMYDNLDTADKKTAPWSFESVRRAALWGSKDLVEWCVSIQEPSPLEKMALEDAFFKGGPGRR